MSLDEWCILLTLLEMDSIQQLDYSIAMTTDPEQSNINWHFVHDLLHILIFHHSSKAYSENNSEVYI